MKEMTTKEVQHLSLEILKDVHEFCVKNEINYSLSGGTLLGAIRHNGFIPWDDDIDIQLPRPDFDRLVKEYKSDNGYKIFYHELNGCECMSYSYARICDVNQTFVDGGVLTTMPTEVGVWIDVLPCDGISSDKQIAIEHINKIKKYVHMLYWQGVSRSKWSNILKGRSFSSKVKYVVKKIGANFICKNPLGPMMKLRRKFDYNDSDYFFCTPHYGLGEWQPKSNMSSFELHKFEDCEFFVMSGYDANLRSLYGDYMTLPPENKRISHDYNRYYWK